MPMSLTPRSRLSSDWQRSPSGAAKAAPMPSSEPGADAGPRPDLDDADQDDA